MGSMTQQDPTLDEELMELADALREHLVWQRACGTTALPQAPPTQEAAMAAALPPAPQAPATATEPRAAAHEGAAVAPVAPRAPRIEVPQDPAARLAKLEQLAAAARACDKCRLHATRTQAVFSRGSPSSELMFVGEGPGADEDAQGVPFVGKAGQLLDKMIKAMGLDPAEVYVCNIVKCRPPENRTPEPDEMAACIPYLHEQIALVAPKAIVALGGTAAKGLLGATEGITRLRGRWRLYRASIPVMPTFHPSYLLRKEDAKRDVWIDLKDVVKTLGRTLPGK